MIRSLTIAGLGPHAKPVRVDLDPAGQSEVIGRSEAGKSTLIEATCFALWGQSSNGKPLPVEAINGDAVSVEIVTAKGTALRREMTRGRKIVRTKGDASIGTEAEWLAGLGPLKNVAACRLAMVPFAWVALSQSAGGGRELRDLLVSILPAGDLRAEVAAIMGADAKPMDPLDEQLATSQRRDANRARDELAGRLAAARERVTATAGGEALGEVVDEERIAWARTVVANARAWRDHRAAAEAAKAAARAAEDWDRRAAELGERPPVVAEGGTLATQRAVQVAEQTRADMERTVAKRLAEIGTARHRLTEAEAAADTVLAEVEARSQRAIAEVLRLTEAGDACPTCRRPGWADAAATLRQAEATASRAATDVEAAIGSANTRREQRLAPLRKAIEDAEKAHRDAEAALTLATTRIEEARTAHAAAMGARQALRSYDDARRALGDRPAVPAVVVAPTVPEPADAEGVTAMATIAQADQAAGAASQRQRDRVAAARELERVAKQHAEAEAEAARLDRLVEALRVAPSKIATRQAEALGDLGPVAIGFPAGGGVEITIDGRPWWLASTGRQVVADLWLRAAIRRAMRVPSLPLFVDRVQDVAGQALPDVGGPVILLRTTADAVMTVRGGL